MAPNRVWSYLGSVESAIPPFHPYNSSTLNAHRFPHIVGG